MRSAAAAAASQATRASPSRPSSRSSAVRAECVYTHSRSSPLGTTSGRQRSAKSSARGRSPAHAAALAAFARQL